MTLDGNLTSDQSDAAMFNIEDLPNGKGYAISANSRYL
jgi:hypothetical protein